MESAGVSGSVPTGAPLLVLVCDDEPAIRRLIQLNLELEGHLVEEVTNGHDAMERLLDEDQPLPHVLLLDGHMDPIDGWGVMDEVRSKPRLAHLPVVLVSAALPAIDAAQVEEAGFTAVLAKPFDPDDLLDVVSRAAGRTRPPESDPRIAG